MPYFNYPPLPYFIGFTAFTPEVPKLYWDVKSAEQRYFTLCEELHKMICYADTLAERLNAITLDFETVINDLQESIDEQLAEQNESIATQLKEQNEQVEKELAAMKSYINQRFDDIAEGQYVYDVTTGTYRPSIETMRRIYSALAYSNTGPRALVSDVSTNLDVAQLANMTVYHAAWSDRDTITIDDQVPNL